MQLTKHLLFASILGASLFAQQITGASAKAYEYMTKLDIAQKRIGDSNAFMVSKVQENSSPVVAKARTMDRSAEVTVTADAQSVQTLHYHSSAKDESVTLRSATASIMALSDPNMDAQNIVTIRDGIDLQKLQEGGSNHFLFRGYSFDVHKDGSGVTIEGSRIE